jgi:hypothetical protein
MPSLYGYDYLVQWLSSVGPVVAHSDGMSALTYQEMDCWQRNTGIELTPWEAETLRMMSCEYLAGIKRYSGEKLPCPDFDMNKLDKRELAKQIQAVMRGGSK